MWNQPGPVTVIYHPIHTNGGTPIRMEATAHNRYAPRGTSSFTIYQVPYQGGPSSGAMFDEDQHNSAHCIASSPSPKTSAQAPAIRRRSGSAKSHRPSIDKMRPDPDGKHSTHKDAKHAYSAPSLQSHAHSADHPPSVRAADHAHQQQHHQPTPPAAECHTGPQLMSIYRLSKHNRSPGADFRMQANREWVRSQIMRMTAIPTPAARGTASASGQPPSTNSPNIAQHDSATPAAFSVDPNTLKWKSWVGQPPDDGESGEISEPGAPYRLTQAEFRRLNDQVREGSASTGVRGDRLQRGSGFKEDLFRPFSAASTPSSPSSNNKVDMFMTYDGHAVPSLPSRQSVYVIKPHTGTRNLAQCGTYAIPNPFPPQKFVTNDQGQQSPVVHRSQLATSFRAFQEKRWRPYEGGAREGGEGTASRISSSRPSSSSSIRSEQRLLEKRNSGRRSPILNRQQSGGHHTPGVSYPHPANRYGPPPGSASHYSDHHSTSSCGPHTSNQATSTRSSQIDVNAVDAHLVDATTATSSIAASQHTLSRQGSVPNLSNNTNNNTKSSNKHSMTPAATEISPLDDSLSLAYDTLTPEIIYQLSAGPRPLSVYGSRPTCYRPEAAVSLSDRSLPPAESGDKVENEGCTHKEQTSPASGKRDTDSTSGIGTDKESGDEDSDDDDDDADRDSNDSDDERIPEPKLEDVKMADLPKLNLRPEQLDAIYIPDQPHDRRRYDFDPMKCEVIPYEFKSALSPHLMALDLHQASLSDRNWRAFTKAPSADMHEEKIIDRLVELERLQRKTKELEMIRRDRLRSAHVRARSRVGMTVRQQSAKLGERKCCSDCLQVACVGDCPSKRHHARQQLLGSSNCLICAEKDCNGRCCESAYDARSRQIRVEEEPKKTLRFRPKSCTSCTSSKNPSKVNNANNLILGRPKSSYSTYSSSNNATRAPRDLRPRGGHIAPHLEEEFERLGISPEPEKDAGTSGDKQVAAQSRRKLKGRASQLPGKSFFSQRRHSLTDIAKEIRVKSANKKRLKSGKKKPSSKTDSEA